MKHEILHGLKEIQSIEALRHSVHVNESSSLVSNSSVNELYGLYLQRKHNEKQSKQGLKVHLSTLVTVTTCCYGAMATALKDLSLEYSLIELQQAPCLKQ